jgi:CheY-like chemotaxis protein
VTIASQTPFPARTSRPFFARRHPFAHARGAALPGLDPNDDGTRQTRRTVLVVDDHQGFRDSLCALLETCGVVAFGVEGARAALQALEEQRDILLALLDVSMPDVDGFTLCERIRASGAECRIVVMSNESTEINRARALALGVAFFHKQDLDDERLQSLLDECGGGET